MTIDIFKEYPSIERYVKTEQNIYTESMKRTADAKNISLQASFLIHVGNGLILEEGNSSKNYSLVKKSWNNFIISDIITNKYTSFLIADRATMQRAKDKALALGIEVSKNTIYPYSQRHLPPSSSSERMDERLCKKEILLTDNYLFLVKLLCRQIGATNLFIEIYTAKEVEALKGQILDKPKASLLPIDCIDISPKFTEIKLIIVGAVVNGSMTQVKAYGKDQLLARAQVKAQLSRGETRYTLNHKQNEMLKKTALRFYAKELGSNSINIIDIASND